MDTASKLYPSMRDAAPAAEPIEQMSAADEKLAAAIYKPAPADKPPALSAAEKLFPSMQADHPMADLGEPDPAPADADAEHEPGEPSEAAAELIDALELDADNPFAGTFAEAAAELGLDAEGGQKLVDLELQHRESYWNKQAAEWQSEACKLGESRISAARDVVRRYAPANFSKSIGVFGDNPALVALLAAVAEDLPS